MTRLEPQHDSKARERAQAAAAPFVIAPELSAPGLLSFGAFLELPRTRELFGMSSDGARLLGELVQNREFLLARSSKHEGNQELWRRMLSDHVRRAYLGDERGLLYWRRVAKVIWEAYQNELSLRRWAARTREGELARAERWALRKEKERARQRERRQRQKAARTRSAKSLSKSPRTMR